MLSPLFFSSCFVFLRFFSSCFTSFRLLFLHALFAFFLLPFFLSFLAFLFFTFFHSPYFVFSFVFALLFCMPFPSSCFFPSLFLIFLCLFILLASSFSLSFIFFLLFLLRLLGLPVPSAVFCRLFPLSFFVMKFSHLLIGSIFISCHKTPANGCMCCRFPCCNAPQIPVLAVTVFNCRKWSLR